MKDQKFTIPRRKIPPFHPICPICNGGMKTIMSSPFADGYHRRHRCRNIHCDATLYSLASYHLPDVQVSHTPFKDRALTDDEMHERLQWWREEDELLERVTQYLAPQQFLNQIQEAYSTPPDQRDEIKQFIVAACDAIQTELKNMASKPEGIENE